MLKTTQFWLKVVGWWPNSRIQYLHKPWTTILKRFGALKINTYFLDQHACIAPKEWLCTYPIFAQALPKFTEMEQHIYGQVVSTLNVLFFSGDLLRTPVRNWWNFWIFCQKKIEKSSLFLRICNRIFPHFILFVWSRCEI